MIIPQLTSDTLSWLLQGDPSVCWQVQRDLIGEKPAVYNQTRSRIHQEGWGKDLLSHQDPAGSWGGGLYGPKWISTHYTLICLTRLGLAPDNPQVRTACQLYLERLYCQTDGGINVHAASAKDPISDTCVTGMALNFLSYFRFSDDRLGNLVDHLLKQQMEDGGWNCDSYKGAAHSSFHSTLSVLEGLLSYQNHIQGDQDLTRSREKAHEFLLQHKLYKSHRTGEVVNSKMTRFPFPPRWFYDVLRALDYFQAADAEKDQRFEDAIELLLSKQKQDQVWPQYRGPSGRIYFSFEEPGKPGRWNTLRAYRVLKWWSGEEQV